MSVVVEVTNDRHCGPLAGESRDDLWDGLSSRLVVHRHTDQLASRLSQSPDLGKRGLHVRRVRVGHRLNNDRMFPTDSDAADVHYDRLPSRPMTQEQPQGLGVGKEMPESTGGEDRLQDASCGTTACDGVRRRSKKQSRPIGDNLCLRPR